MSLRQGLPPHVIIKYVRMIKVHDGEVIVWGFLGNEVLIESRVIVRQTIRGIQETLHRHEEYYVRGCNIKCIHRRGVFRTRRIQMYTLAPIKRHKITHTVSIEKTVILVFVECYESLKVLILVQQGVAGRGGDLRRIRRTR
jgi:hypothetical protein